MAKTYLAIYQAFNVKVTRKDLLCHKMSHLFSLNSNSELGNLPLD